MAATIEYVDRLSTFPEEIRSNILSLMPTKSAMRTSILSRSWRYSWMWVHNLDFGEIHPIPDLNCFLDFVNRVLEHCKATQVKIFRLNFTKAYVPESVVSKWITEAVRLKVCELHLKVRHIKLPLSFFLNKTLTDISLDFTELHFPLLDGESKITLPCVKTLDIVISSQPHENVSKLIHGCPELRNLSVGIKNCNQPQHYHYKIPTLKRLKLSIYQSVSYISPVYLQLPNLEHFFVDGLLCLEFVEEDLDLSSLINAKVTCHVKDDGLWVELLERISQAKSISLNIMFWNPESELDVCVEPLPNFPNLKHLEVEGYVGAEYQLIPQILESCSELEHLSIVKPKGGHWNQPEVVPTCMVGNLKTVKYAETRAQDFNRDLLNYILVNSNVLKTLTIACDNMFCPSEEQRLLSELMINPRDPEDCRICFLSNYNSFEGVLYCRPHFDQLFKQTGSLDKSFDGTPKIIKSPKTIDGEKPMANKVSSMFVGTQDKCLGCNKTTYPMERVTVNGTAYHKSCFKCIHGGCTISPSNYIAHEGRLYCRHHHTQLIKEKGNLSQLEGDHSARA